MPFAYLTNEVRSVRDLLAGLPEIGTVPPDNTQEVLVLHNMREAFFYARRCCRSKLPDDEIFSACYEALCHAARNWHPDGIRFFGYAKPYVRGGLSKAWRSKDVVRNKKGECHCELSLAATISHPQENDEIEESDGLTGVMIRGKITDYAPTCDPDTESVCLREEYEILKPMLKQLTDKEQSVVSLRYRSGFTFERIGALLGTSPADSQVTHARALRKLRRLAKQKLGTIN